MIWPAFLFKAIFLGGIFSAGLADDADQADMRTHYNILQLSKDCTVKEIKKSYRKLALELHPDKVKSGYGFPGNCSSAEELKELFLSIQEAYAVLSSATRRVQYDLQLSGVDYVDFTEPEVDRYMSPGKPFRMYVKTPTYRISFATTAFPQLAIPAIDIEIKLNLMDNINGLENHKHTFLRRQICGACHGTGSKNGDVEVCSFCSGIGQASHLFRHADGQFEQMTNTSCGMCDGRGFLPKEKCDVCGGKGVVIGENSLGASFPRGFVGSDSESVPNHGHVSRDSRIGAVSLTVVLDLPEGWKILKSGADSKLHHVVNVPFQEYVAGFSKTVFTPVHGESFSVERGPVKCSYPAEGIGAGEDVDANAHAHTTNTGNDDSNSADVIHALTHGFTEDVDGYGLYSSDAEKLNHRDFLTVKIVCDFSQSSAVEVITTLIARELLQPLKSLNEDQGLGSERRRQEDSHNGTKTRLAQTRIQSENQAKVRGKTIRDYSCLLKHLAQVQKQLKIDDFTLLDLLEEFSAVMMDISVNVQEPASDYEASDGGNCSHEECQHGEEQRTRKDSEKMHSPSLDDFDFGLVQDDISFTT